MDRYLTDCVAVFTTILLISLLGSRGKEAHALENAMNAYYLGREKFLLKVRIWFVTPLHIISQIMKSF